MIIALSLILPLIAAACQGLGKKHYIGMGWFATVCLFGVLLGSVWQLCWGQPTVYPTFTFFKGQQIQLDIRFMLDNLSLVMLCLTGSVAGFVNLYALRYLYSDSHRSRFMLQLALVVFSVNFLVVSGNLLTAFIAWQCIGLNLYWLLNHYHGDTQANRAAKKKFVVNRLGDMGFLLAIILSLYYFGNTDFHTIFTNSQVAFSLFGVSVSARALIIASVFLAVMTKSAQFPFHIWLPDTMQTPTPVSAIMHAGVINAGGFLLTRLSPGLIAMPSVLLWIASIGLITVFMGNWFAASQPDVKKQLAYSTMAQMGYMIMQCGIGYFAGAIFHLVAHGFFKAWSFLDAGNSLTRKKINYGKLCWQTGVITIACLVPLLALSFWHHAQHLRELFIRCPLILLFLLITWLQATWAIWQYPQNISRKIGAMFCLALVSWLYLQGLSYLPLPTTTLSLPIQITFLLLIVVSIGIYLWPSAKLQYSSYNKLHVEAVYRQYLLQPLRHWGDYLYQTFYKKRVLAVISGLILIGGISTTFSSRVMAKEMLVLWSLLLILLLVTANRARKLSAAVICLSLAQYGLGVLALQFASTDARQIAFYQFINTTLLMLLLFYSLYKLEKGKRVDWQHDNRLPWLSAYFTAALFCLIGLPGTATFVSEIVIATNALQQNLLLTLSLLLSLLLLTVSVLHILQEHIFQTAAIQRFAVRLSSAEHVGYGMIFLFNIANGFFPHFFIQHF